MGECAEDFDWDADSESQMKRSGSVNSVLGSVIAFSNSKSEASLLSKRPSLSAAKTKINHHRLRSQSQSIPSQHKTIAATPSLRLTTAHCQPHATHSISNGPHSTPVAQSHNRLATSRATSPHTLSPAHQHSFQYRKLPRSYRSPSSTLTVNQAEHSTANVNREFIPPISRSLLMASLYQSSDTTKRPDRNTKMYTFKARGVGGLGSKPACASVAAATAEEGSLSTLQGGSTTALCENIADKPPNAANVVRLTAPPKPLRPSAAVVDNVTSNPTSNVKSRNKSARFSFQLNNRPDSSSSDKAATQSARQDGKQSKRPLSRRRDRPRGEEYTVKLETESKRGDTWDEEGGNSKTMTMLPKWKAAFGRARGKSIEGDSPSSPLRRNVFASKSQTDLTRLQKLFREEASAENANLPIPRSSIGCCGDRPIAVLESPLVTANKERGKFRAYPPSANRFDSSGRSQSRGQAGSYIDNLPSSPRHVSSDSSSATHTGDDTPLKPRQKRQGLLRRPGTSQGPYTAPNTPLMKARPGTSGGSSNRIPFHPASDPVLSKRLIPVQVQKSCISAPLLRTEQMTTGMGGLHHESWSRPDKNFQITPNPMKTADKVESENMTAGRPCNSPLLQVLQTETRPGMPSPSMTNPLFHTMNEQSQPFYHNQQSLLLSPAQIIDPSAKRLSDMKVQEVRGRISLWDDAIVAPAENQQEFSPYDTPRSSLCRYTEAASSAGPATPFSSRSRQSTISANTFYCAGIDTVDIMPEELERRIAEEDRDGTPMDKGDAERYKNDSSFADEIGDQTVVPAPEQDGSPIAWRNSRQEGVSGQYRQEHLVNLGMLLPAGQESRRGSNDSRATVMCTTDSSASFSLDAEFWLVQAAEKRTIVARTVKAAAVNRREQNKEACIEEKREEIQTGESQGSRPASRGKQGKGMALRSTGVYISEEKEPLSLEIEVKWKATRSDEAYDGGATSGSISLSNADIDAIGRAWLRQKASKLSLTSSQEVQALRSDDEIIESTWLNERLTLEQRQEEILKTSSDAGGIFRVRSAPAFVRRTPTQCKSLTLERSSSRARKWQRKPLVLTPRNAADQSTPIEDPLLSDGSTTRRYLISPHTASSSSMTSSPSPNIETRKARSSRSPMGPAPLGEWIYQDEGIDADLLLSAYKRSISSFSTESELSRSLPVT